MPANCLNCPCWQGTKYSKWGDCFRVVGKLEPRLSLFKSRYGTHLVTPFDPHDVKYFVHNPGFYKVYKKLIKSKDLPDGVRVHKITRKDTTFDRRTGEFGEVVSVPLYYFQTRWDYKCGGDDESNNGV